MKKYLIMVCSVLMVFTLVGLIGCTSSTSTSAPSPSVLSTSTPSASSAVVPDAASPAALGESKTLTIGIATPLTGTMAFLGNQISNTAQMAINDQNAKGGLTIGGQNYTLVPLIRDTKGDAATGKSIGQEMISDGVKIIIGPFQADAVAIQSDIEANKVLTFFVDFLTPDMTGPTKLYSFADSFPDIQMTYKQLYYIQKTYPEAKTVFSINADTPIAPSWIAATTEAANMLGYEYLGSENIPVTTTDFTSVITRILSHNPDILDTGGMGGDMGGLTAQMIKQLGQAGYTGIIMTPAAAPEELMEQVVPAETLDKVVTTYINVNGPVVDSKYADVMNRFQSNYNQQGTDIVSSYYNNIAALFEFLNTQDSLDSAVWMQGFAAYKWNGIMGFQSQWVQLQGAVINRHALNNQWVTHYKDGKPVTDFTVPLPTQLFLDANGNPIVVSQ